MNQPNRTILLKGIQIYSENRKIEYGYIKLKEQKVIEIGPLEELVEEEPCEIIALSSNYIAVPGFIDVHIHGVSGADEMDATSESLDMMTKALPAEGTTSFLATTNTQTRSEIEKALSNANKYMERPQEAGRAEIMGIHLEGPFVNPKNAGVQPKDHIVDPNLELFKK